MDFGG
jgi:hypothetical protein